MNRRAPPREARHGEIEAAPEEMHRAHFAEKTAAEQLEDAIGLNQRAPETIRCGGIVARMDMIFGKADRVRNFIRQLVDGNRDADALQKIPHLGIEVGNALSAERQRAFHAVAAARDKTMRDEIEFEFEDIVADGHRRSAEAARGDVKRYLPAMIQPRRQLQPDLADDLRPELQGRDRVAPCRVG